MHATKCRQILVSTAHAKMNGLHQNIGLPESNGVQQISSMIFSEGIITPGITLKQLFTLKLYHWNELVL